MLGISVTADVIESNARAACGPSGATVEGSSLVLNLAINGLTIDITGQPNQTVYLPLGLGRLVINEQMISTTGTWSSITVNALHLYVNNVGDVALASSHADITCVPPSRIYGGQGTVVDSTVLELTTRVSDTGPLPSWGGERRSSVPAVNIAGLITTGLLTAKTKGSGDKSNSDAQVANVKLTVAGLITIQASVLKTTAQAMCSGSTPVVSGTSQIVALKINNLPILVTGQPNQVIPLVVGSLTLNERISSVSGSSGKITMNALHLRLLGIADVALSSSRAAIGCVALPACPAP